MTIKYYLSKYTNIDKFIDHVTKNNKTFTVTKSDEDRVVYVHVTKTNPEHLLIVGANLGLSEVSYNL